MSGLVAASYHQGWFHGARGSILTQIPWKTVIGTIATIGEVETNLLVMAKKHVCLLLLAWHEGLTTCRIWGLGS